MFIKVSLFGWNSKVFQQFATSGIAIQFRAPRSCFLPSLTESHSVLAQLKIQLNNQEDLYTNFWNSFSVQSPPLRYSAPQISIVYLWVWIFLPSILWDWYSLFVFHSFVLYSGRYPQAKIQRGLFLLSQGHNATRFIVQCLKIVFYIFYLD